MPSLHDPIIQKLYHQEKSRLESTQIPIVTVSGAFQEDLKEWMGQKFSKNAPDIIFSRAHFTMAYAALLGAGGGVTDPKKAWLVDPTNYAVTGEFGNIRLTEKIGETIARSPFLQIVKQIIDRFGRQKLPILKSITPPLLYLFENVDKPILSFHIAAGNILAGLGKTVVQVVTDPHVRDEYLNNAHLPNFYLCVFDEETKISALEKAVFREIEVDPERIIVTGPPIDHRVINLGTKKRSKITSPLRLLITTGGLGTNKADIFAIIEQLLPLVKKKDAPYQIRLYAGTEADFVKKARQVASKYHTSVKVVSSTEVSRQDLNDEKFVILHHPQLFDANEILLRHGLGWADGVITKPSGDMAYDAVAAGCFLLTLSPWGDWEVQIEERFRQLEISRQAQVNQIVQQLQALSLPFEENPSWIAQSKDKIKNLDPTFYNGVKNILTVYEFAADCW